MQIVVETNSFRTTIGVVLSAVGVLAAENSVELIQKLRRRRKLFWKIPFFSSRDTDPLAFASAQFLFFVLSANARFHTCNVIVLLYVSFYI